VQSAKSRMIGIGTPSIQSSIERIAGSLQAVVFVHVEGLTPAAELAFRAE